MTAFSAKRNDGFQLYLAQALSTQLWSRVHNTDNTDFAGLCLLALAIFKRAHSLDLRPARPGTSVEAWCCAGMHGAALAWTVLLPPYAGVLELWPQADGIWRCYEHMAGLVGAQYRCVCIVTVWALLITTEPSRITR